MKLKELLEEWKATIKYFKWSYDIFVNPDSKEMRELKKEGDVRWIIDFKKKNIYVFSSELVHDLAAEELGIPYNFNQEVKGYNFGGASDIENGKIIYTVSGGAKGFKQKWLQKYFKVIEWKFR